MSEPSSSVEATLPLGDLAGSVFTIAPGDAFLPALARAILRGDLPKIGGDAPQPIDLSNVTLLMPTRRAQRSLTNAFLSTSGQRAMLLPKIRPISERDEELALLSEFADLPKSLDSGVGDLPALMDFGVGAAIDPMQRVLLLTRLVMQWSQAMRSGATSAHETSFRAAVVSAGARTPAQAVNMAQELAQLMDLVEAEGMSLDGLEEIVPLDLTHHWKLTLDFLKIITQFWPEQLCELGLLSPWQRQNSLILAEAQRISARKPEGPMIVAGVTGSIPVTVELMRAVLLHDNGAIVLPGVDFDLDEDSWQEIVPSHPEHPQFGLKKLLDELGLARADVALISDGHSQSGRRAQSGKRAQFVSEAMRPAATTQLWHKFAQEADTAGISAALSNVSLIEAPTPFDEAEVIALVMRNVAETPGKTAALVSPDRMLARRVAIRLKAWGIDVDDSAGRPFVKTVPGAFLDLVIECVAKDFAPAELMALLKHPLCRIGLEAREIRFGARALEIAAFRTTYIGRGIDGVEAALERAARECADRERRGRAVLRLFEEDWQRARALVAKLRVAFEPLTQLFSSDTLQPLGDLASAHMRVGEALCRLNDDKVEDGASDKNLGDDDAPGSPLYLREAGAFASTSFSALISEHNGAPDIHGIDYPDVYRSLIGRQNVRERSRVHPRLSIWGPIEARLLHADVMILGSLNDGVWPDSAEPGPWLNRPMRSELGLPAPEEAIGRKAFDFTSFLGAPEVIMTRAKKMDGVPGVPSRWLMRMSALLDGLGLSDALHSETPWLAWAHVRDSYEKREEIAPPRPVPPVSMRPRRLSVSSIETLIANPYAIFASKILGLEPLPMLGAQPGAALRGGIIHSALARFASAYPDTLPDDSKAALLEIAREVLTDYSGHPRVAAFWLPRFERFAEWFAQSEPARRVELEKTFAEVSGSLTFSAPGGPFVLSARADRIDVTRTGVVITDYKTGTMPSDKKVLSGVSPQLPLEAGIALDDGFANVTGLPLRALRYIRASGGEPPGEEHTIKTDDVDALARTTIENLKALVATFDNPATAYACLRRHQFTYDYDDFAHLARVAEWSLSGFDDSGAGS